MLDATHGQAATTVYELYLEVVKLRKGSSGTSFLSSPSWVGSAIGDATPEDAKANALAGYVQIGGSTSPRKASSVQGNKEYAAPNDYGAKLINVPAIFNADGVVTQYVNIISIACYAKALQYNITAYSGFHGWTTNPTLNFSSFGLAFIEDEYNLVGTVSAPITLPFESGELWDGSVAPDYVSGTPVKTGPGYLSAGFELKYPFVVVEWDFEYIA
jgi:hypothetical protein